MNKVTKYALVVAGLNVAAFLLLLVISISVGDNLDVALTLLFFVPLVLLLLELIVGIVFLFIESKKELGSGLLIGCGITLLIGLSVCGVMANA